MRTIASGMASTPRNPTIAKVLYLRKAIEMWGRGIGLILDACEKAHLAAPKIYEDRGFVYTVFARPTAQEWQDKVGETDDVNHDANHEFNVGTNWNEDGTKDGTKDVVGGTIMRVSLALIMATMALMRVLVALKMTQMALMMTGKMNCCLGLFVESQI